MVSSPLPYRDFIRICHAVRRLQQEGLDSDRGSIREALVNGFQTAHPSLASTLSQLKSWELETLLGHVERHNLAS
jgi:hypothetical protein